MSANVDGFLHFPYTTTDWAIITVAISATLFKILMMYYTEPKVSLNEVASVLLVSYVSSIGLYEIALNSGWNIGLFFLPFSILVVSSKDIADWLLLDKDGRRFIIETIKEMINKLINK